MHHHRSFESHHHEHGLLARAPDQNSSAAASPKKSSSSDIAFTHGLTGVNVPYDVLFTQALFFFFLGLCVITLAARLLQQLNAHLRHLHCLSATAVQQQFWMKDRWRWYPDLKKHLIWAPFWKKRHNREFQLSSAVNFGTLPSRYHSVLLLMYLASNFAYCAVLDYRSQNKSQVLAELRGRTGVLATANLVPLVILSGRNNPLIRLLRVSYDTYNLLHRWIGRMVVVEAVAHTLAWLVNTIIVNGSSGVGKSISSSPFMAWGMVGTCCMLFLVLQSPSAIRHAFYETFLHFHQLGAFAAILGTYMHLKVHHISQLSFVQLAFAAWALERGWRVVRILYRCYTFRKGWTTIQVEALPGEACRVTFDLRRPWSYVPGSHMFVYMPRISLHQSHPFSIAWKHDEPDSPTSGGDVEKMQTAQLDYDNPTQYHTSLSIVVARRTGMTNKLYEKAIASPEGRFTTRGAVEGPYGGLESLQSYGTVILIAGGIGITHQIGYVRDLLRGYDEGTIATRKIVLVWTVRNTENLEWVRPWMDVILQMRGRRDVLKVLLFVTRPKSPREVISPSATVQMYPGRPDPQSILDKEIESRVGAIAVTVCGPGSLADSVREAARKRVDVASLDFIEESFTW